MVILLMLVPVSIVLLGGAIWAFVWAVRSGQFENLDTPALDILHDDDGEPTASDADADADADAGVDADGDVDVDAHAG